MHDMPEVGTMVEVYDTTYEVCSYAQVCEIDPEKAKSLPISTDGEEVVYLYSADGNWVGFEFLNDMDDYTVVTPAIDIDGAW